LRGEPRLPAPRARGGARERAGEGRRGQEGGTVIDQVAVLGLGAMGLPMAERLAESSPVRGFDVAAARLQAAAQVGVSPVDRADDAVTGASHVVIAVRDAAQMEAVLFGPQGAAARLESGSVVVITSTVGAGPV